MSSTENQKIELRRILEDCIDSLEYVNKAHPEATGSGVRLERIAKARAYLSALERGLS